MLMINQREYDSLNNKIIDGNGKWNNDQVVNNKE